MSKPLKLCPNARALAQFIDSHTRVRGFAPNIREMRDHFRFKHRASILRLLDRLEALGIVESARVNGHRRERGARVVAPRQGAPS